MNKPYLYTINNQTLLYKNNNRLSKELSVHIYYNQGIENVLDETKTQIRVVESDLWKNQSSFHPSESLIYALQSPVQYKIQAGFAT